jgi:hypothetical protein
MSWLEILENHFQQRKKAFLIFDDANVLRYISNYAKDILEFDEGHIGFITLNELFPPTAKNPHFLVDKNYSYQTIHDVMYTTPSGRSKELRINRDSELQSVGEIKGYIVWIESKSRDLTAVYKRVSSLDPFLNFTWLFSQNEIGFILINKEGKIEKYNDQIKFYLTDPGEWKGRSIFTFPFLHQHGITDVVVKGMKKCDQPQSTVVSFKYAGLPHLLDVKWSVLPLCDLERSIVGGIITATSLDNKNGSGQTADFRG